MYDVTGKVALITGGTRGIGLAIAEDLLTAGATVVVNGRAETEDATDLLNRHGPDRVAIELGDVAVTADNEAMVARTVERFGRLDILVHSAGGPVPGKMLDLDEAAWRGAFEVHVHPIFTLFRAAHPHLAKEGGAVILVSSVAGIRGCPGTIAYQTVKGAMIPLAKALALDHAAEDIRVNVLAPGIIRTRFHEAMTEEAKAHNLTKRIPLGREGTPHHVAAAARQLIENDFMTGEIIVVDGGMSMRVTG
ncbi:SDR family NAD(P)-dependent oxidoreductase [Roseospira visakhapatnamensis]|uniref:NAD(P)-dependent dehydrogenase (Short-subunit alcohol dehydrogenase family) n=1 Tax=Roseospira visakhapatnamensis TaxID=390880 RepID=A0A7W6RET0_9PROT|nr:SDR family oxidoreductase [Roseospira visakhapatnamensis]MBB4266608.1 NAD(P)-dependent dehydrogenase (short-subunit alcohol dehydrogenase family) [Roseospira visakhapatnamensis]